MKIQWRRVQGGGLSSADGRFRIRPVWHRYNRRDGCLLDDVDEERAHRERTSGNPNSFGYIGDYFSTQAKAKAEAERRA